MELTIAPIGYRASDITELLVRKYPIEKFLSVPECKIGSTVFKYGCPRFDLWVMARSWAHPRFIGCEIKVTRQDFLRDVKWQDYLPYCTEFYFVATPGVIDPGEVPETAGLMVTSKNCKRLITKKKAPVRDVEIPQSILIYLLMCRTRVTADNTGRELPARWQDRLKQMKANKGLGHDVAYHIRSLVDKKVKDVRDENQTLKEENRRFEIIKDCMEELGVSPGDLQIRVRHGIEHKLKEVMSGIPFDLIQFLKQVELNASQAIKALETK
ncbi:hypothetical protein LCGC14_0612630 [marine sediment metagenome]|uniref:MmcB family DNA repair protein n=1 Tax=marine sediment metagenome TaxID=412755 RepID=A0A0F9RBY2_9ZZZZ